MNRQPSGPGPELSQVVSCLDVDSCLYRDVLWTGLCKAGLAICIPKPHFLACCLMSSEALLACCKAWMTEKWEGANGKHPRFSSMG